MHLCVFNTHVFFRRLDVSQFTVEGRVRMEWLNKESLIIIITKLFISETRTIFHNTYINKLTNANNTKINLPNTYLMRVFFLI